MKKLIIGLSLLAGLAQAQAQTAQTGSISLAAWAGQYSGQLAQRNTNDTYGVTVNFLPQTAKVGSLVAKGTAIDGACSYEYYLAGWSSTSLYTNAKVISGNCFSAPVEFHYAIGQDKTPQMVWSGFYRLEGGEILRSAAPNTFGVLRKVEK